MERFYLYSATGFVWDILENSSDRDGRTPSHIKRPNLIVYCYINDSRFPKNNFAKLKTKTEISQMLRE